MKRRLLWICLGTGALLILIVVISLSGWFREIVGPTSLDMEVVPLSQVNYNNYMTENSLDYKGNQFAWQYGASIAPKLIVRNSNGENTGLSGITKPFQIVNDSIVYIKKSQLLQHSISDQQEQCIAQPVSEFIATEQAVFYSSESNLFQYSLIDKNTTKLKTGIIQFYFYHDQLHVVLENGELMRLMQDGTWQELCVLQITGYPFAVMPQGDFVICRCGNELLYTNIYTGKTETVRLSEGDYVNNRIYFICDDRQLFVSFQATQTNGSLVKDIDHTDNGVWRLDSETKKPVKLCNETFEQLYLFSETQLFGVREGKLFQIDTATGSTRELT